LHVCELLIFEADTGKATLANCVTGYVVEQVPSDPMSFVVFSALTDGKGTVTVQVMIQRPDDLESIYDDAAVLTFDDPLSELWCRFVIRDCVFPIEGDYQISLVVDNEIVTQRRFTIQVGGEE